MPRPTDSDWKAFESISLQNKVEVLYNYLCMNAYSMPEVGKMVFGDYNGHEAQRVSVITRCYGLEGVNKGRYAHLDLEKADVKAFVKKYPKGCDFDGGWTMTQFFEERVRKKQKKAAVSFEEEYGVKESGLEKLYRQNSDSLNYKPGIEKNNLTKEDKELEIIANMSTVGICFGAVVGYFKESVAVGIITWIISFALLFFLEMKTKAFTVLKGVFTGLLYASIVDIMIGLVFWLIDGHVGENILEKSVLVIVGVGVYYMVFSNYKRTNNLAEDTMSIGKLLKKLPEIINNFKKR